ERAVSEIQTRRFAISVSSDEIAEASEAYWKLHDPKEEFEKNRKRWVNYNEAASEVFDQHQDPEKVYQALMVPLGDPPSLARQIWQANLVQWSRPEGRASLARMATIAAKWTFDDFKKRLDKPSRQMLEKQKLDDAIDDQLAAQ